MRKLRAGPSRVRGRHFGHEIESGGEFPGLAPGKRFEGDLEEAAWFVRCPGEEKILRIQCRIEKRVTLTLSGSASANSSQWR